MKIIGGFLDRFFKSIGRDTLIRETILDVVKEQTRITLLPTDIALKESTLEITASPAKKNEIRLKEKRILDALIARTGIRLTNIRYL